LSLNVQLVEMNLALSLGEHHGVYKASKGGRRDSLDMGNKPHKLVVHGKPVAHASLQDFGSHTSVSPTDMRRHCRL
jgi:fructose/tagatose bisphosphate aldolase